MSVSVQVFGRLQVRIIHPLGRPAFEKRQGRKSRSVGRNRISAFGGKSGNGPLRMSAALLGL